MVFKIKGVFKRRKKNSKRKPHMLGLRTFVCVCVCVCNELMAMAYRFDGFETDCMRGI